MVERVGMMVGCISCVCGDLVKPKMKGRSAVECVVTTNITLE